MYMYIRRPKTPPYALEKLRTPTFWGWKWVGVGVVGWRVLLRGTILNRTYGTHKTLYISLFLLKIFGSIYYGPPYYDTTGVVFSLPKTFLIDEIPRRGDSPIPLEYLLYCLWFVFPRPWDRPSGCNFVFSRGQGFGWAKELPYCRSLRK